MEIDVLEQLKQTAQAFGTSCHICKDQKSFEEEQDLRIYQILGIEPELEDTMEEIIHLCEPGVLYIVINQFQIYGMAFVLKEGVISIGPFVVDTTEEILPSVMEKNQIPLIFQNELKEYYNSLPLIKETAVLESLVIMNMRYLFADTIDIRRTYIDNFTYDVKRYNELQLLEENKVSMETIEYRYKIEDRFLEAIGSGDREKVLEIEKMLSNYRMAPRVASQFRNGQNALIILNTLMRRAVQEADVHPAHIDRLSTDFANRIETAKNDEDLRNISRDMIRKYCILAQNYSLIGHSQMVRDAMNYIDFNLNEDLSLNVIAEKLSVNASYLSKQFKKENNKNLTDYVNGKRVSVSLKYLATTDLPIQEVAELVGIYDENYFSRLFKKYQQITPSKYRSLMKKD